jgi:hypothetical protein
MKKGARILRKVADEATFIRCRYCDIKENCSKRDSKEASEAKGILTYCAITPNKNKKQLRKQ